MELTGDPCELRFQSLLDAMEYDIATATGQVALFLVGPSATDNPHAGLLLLDIWVPELHDADKVNVKVDLHPQRLRQLDGLYEILAQWLWWHGIPPTELERSPASYPRDYVSVSIMPGRWTAAMV